MIWLGYSLSTDPKHDGKQNYLCRDCNRQFIGDHNLTYPGCHSGIDRTILKMLVRNCGIRDISEITGCSRYKVQKVLKISQHHVFPKKNHYDSLEVDELWTFVGNKKNKVWLIVESLIKSNESKEPKQQGIHISQPPLFPQPFDPCPCLLYRVEIRAIGRKPQHRMPLSLQRIQRVLPLVEGSIIHHDHALSPMYEKHRCLCCNQRL